MTPDVDRMTVRLDGVFDVPAAQRLARTLAEAGEREVLVDLEHVREFHDLAVVHLARALSGRRTVAVSGLRTHHLRLLRYLGMGGGAIEAEAGQLA